MTEHEKITFSVVVGFLTSLSQKYDILLIIVCVAIVFDFFTGIIKCLATGQPLSSKKGFQGFWKKVSLISAFAFGIFLDCFIPIALDTISIELPFNCPFASIIGVYITLNESISIAENLIDTNPNTVPKWVLRILKKAKENTENIKNKEE